jgi:hypothetical protein
MKKILKIAVITILVLNVLILTSCRSGWSCKKRYVNTHAPEQVEKKRNC